MSYRPITYCPECGEPHDTYAAGELCSSCAFEKAMSSDYSKRGVFQTHNCYRCKDGALPCIKGEGNERQCDTLHARND